MKKSAINALAAFSLLAGLTSVTSAHADELDFDNYRKFLMSGEQGHKKLAIQTTCTSAQGEVYRIGEAGYDNCLNAVRAHAEKKQTEVGKSESLAAPAPAVGATIHLGE